MKSSGLRGLNQIVIALFLLMGPFVAAYAACCSGHGGVASCNKSTGYQMCKDGTTSPSCTCAKATTPPKTTKATKATPATTTTNTTTSTPTKAKATKTKASTTSASGCCSHHGGIAQCNKSTGHQMCKDGTASPSCTCQ